MAFESSVYTAIKTAIMTYPAYTTVWDKTIFTVEDFDADIPSGTRHKGACPFVAILGGMTDDFTQTAGDLFEGSAEVDIMLCIARPLVSTDTDWNVMQTFTAEIERALTEIEGNGVLMRPSTSKEAPQSGKGMVKRVLTISIDGAECRQMAADIQNYFIDDAGLNQYYIDDANSIPLEVAL